VSPPRKNRGRSEAEEILGPENSSLLDIVDNLLNKGVVLSGDLTIGLAQIDLVYAKLSLLLSAADRVLPVEPTDFIERHHARRALRARRRDGERIASARQATRRRSRA
jgi:Gas vesicle protein